MPASLRRLTLFILLLVFWLPVTDAKQPSFAGESSQPRQVALVLQAMTSDLTRRMERAALIYQKAHPDKFRLQVTGVMHDVEVEQQIKQVEQLIKETVYGLVIDPVDGRRLVPVLDRAHRKGIRIVVIHNHLDWQAMGRHQLLVPFVGPDNRQAAKEAGLYLAEKLKPGDQVAILKSKTGMQASFERTNGFREAMHQQRLSNVATISAQGQEDNATRITTKLLGEFPALRAIMATNDEMAIGVVQALKSSKAAGKVFVVSFGASFQIKSYIEGDSVLVAVDPQPEQMVVEGITTVLTGKAGNQTLSARLIDRSNCKSDTAFSSSLTGMSKDAENGSG